MAFKTRAQIEATKDEPIVFKKPPIQTVTLTLAFAADQRFDMDGNVVFVLAGKRADTGRGIALDKTLSPDPTRAELITWRAFKAGQTLTVTCYPKGSFGHRLTNASSPRGARTKRLIEARCHGRDRSNDLPKRHQVRIAFATPCPGADVIAGLSAALLGTAIWP